MKKAVSDWLRACAALAAIALVCGTALGARRDGVGLFRAGRPAETGTVSLPSGATVHRDISYGDDARHRMDVYLPAQAHHAPVILMVHGGGWRVGDKANRRVTKNKIARWLPRGIVLVSVNYRLLPDVDPLRQAEDVARALAAAQARADGWHADPSRFVLMGHSAGAHLVALLSANPATAFRQGAKPWLGTVVLDGAALDVPRVMRTSHPRLYDEAFGTDPDYWRSVSPAQQLSVSAVPMLIACSTLRPDHPCGAARALADQATRLKVRMQVLPQGLSHSEMNERVGKAGAYTAAIEAFLATLDRSLADALARGVPDAPPR